MMTMVSLTDGMRQVSLHAHDVELLLGVLHGYYVNELTETEKAALTKAAAQLRDIRDITATLARDYCKAPEIDR